MARTVAIVLNWRTPDMTRRCVESLLVLRADLDIVVVDNASGDGSLNTLAEDLRQSAALAGYDLVVGSPPSMDRERQRLFLLDAGRNGGYAYGNNFGIKFALKNCEFDYIWILNSDTFVPEANSLTALVDKMATNPKIGLCGSCVVYSSNPTKVQTLGGGAFDKRWGKCWQIGQGTSIHDVLEESEVERKIDYVNGACCFVRKAVIDKSGFMDEGYFLYYEEIDWAMVVQQDFKIGFCANSVVHHDVGGTIGTEDLGIRSTTSTYYLTRSRARFLFRRSRTSLPCAYLDLARELAQQIKRRRWAAAWAMTRGMLLL